MPAAFYNAILDKLKQQIAVSGEAVCHNRIMQEALQDLAGTVGEPTVQGYARGMATLMTELKATCRMQKTEHGFVMVFTPDSSMRS